MPLAAGAMRFRSGPLDFGFDVAGGAVGEVAVDERLVGQTDLGGQLFEVPHGFDIQPNGDRLLELGRIGVLRGCAEVVFVFHDRKLQYCVDSFFVAFRAEMIRISSSRDR